MTKEPIDIDKEKRLSVRQSLSFNQQTVDFDAIYCSINNTHIENLRKTYPLWKKLSIPQLNLFNTIEPTRHNLAMRYFLSLEKDKHIQESITHCFNTSAAFDNQKDRLNCFFLAKKKDRPDKPVAFISFNLSITDNWRAIGRNPTSDEIGVCCHLMYVYVIPSWRKQGTAHCLVDIMTLAFFNQLKTIGKQLIDTGFEATPIIYQGYYAQGLDKLLHFCKSQLEQPLTNEQANLPLHSIVTNF